MVWFVVGSFLFFFFGFIHSSSGRAKKKRKRDLIATLSMPSISNRITASERMRMTSVEPSIDDVDLRASFLSIYFSLTLSIDNECCDPVDSTPSGKTSKDQPVANRIRANPTFSLVSVIGFGVFLSFFFWWVLHYLTVFWKPPIATVQRFRAALHQLHQ